MKLQAFDRELSVNLCNNHITVYGLFCPVDDHNVAVIESELFHAAATCPDEERRCAAADTEFVKIELFLDVVLSRGGETGCAGLSVKWQL